MAKYNLKLENATLHISKGNGKMGKVHSFSTLPGNEYHLLSKKDGTLLTDIFGTCSNNCYKCFNGCYAKRSAIQHNNVVIKAWGDNTLLLRDGSVWGMIDDYLSSHNIDIFRINVSGEIESVNDLWQWQQIALKHPNTTFGLYTKNYDALDSYINSYGLFTDNFIINVSQWHGVADAFLAKYPKDMFNVFEYDDMYNLDNKKHCPAVNKDGSRNKNINCATCKNCYRKNSKTTYVYAH